MTAATCQECRLVPATHYRDTGRHHVMLCSICAQFGPPPDPVVQFMQEAEGYQYMLAGYSRALDVALLAAARVWRRAATDAHARAQRCPARDRVRWGIAALCHRQRARRLYREAIIVARRCRPPRRKVRIMPQGRPQRILATLEFR